MTNLGRHAENFTISMYLDNEMLIMVRNNIVINKNDSYYNQILCSFRLPFVPRSPCYDFILYLVDVNVVSIIIVSCDMKKLDEQS